MDGGGRGRQRGDTELFQTPLKVGGAHVSALQRALDVLLEEPPVCLQDFCRFLVQWVLGVRLLGGGARVRGRSHTNMAEPLKPTTHFTLLALLTLGTGVELNNPFLPASHMTFSIQLEELTRNRYCRP